jgi:hypothetical protein
MEQTAVHACQVCDNPAALYDVVDFNKNCRESEEGRLALSGVPIYYRRCAAYGYAWASEFRQWSDSDFLNHIYNEDYVHVDPDYLESRPQGNAQMVNQLFGRERVRIRHLDYGGGNGGLSTLLAEQDWNTASFDPFPGDGTTPESLGKFNLITSFEVFEHVPDPDALMSSLRTLMDEECLVLFSTLVSDGAIVPNGRLTWWYASPRKGHISLFSARSLALLAERHGLNFRSFSPTTHCFYNVMPAWAGMAGT